MDLVLFLNVIVALQKKTPSWTITGPSSCSLESLEKGVSPGGLPHQTGLQAQVVVVVGCLDFNCCRRHQPSASVTISLAGGPGLCKKAG